MGRRKIIRLPEEIKELEKKRYQKYKGYFKTYSKLNYLKKKITDPNYNQKRYQKTKLKKLEEKEN